MSGVLALVSRPIESIHSGYDLRVANLCAQLSDEVHLLVVPLVPPAQSPTTARPTLSPGSFVGSVQVLAPLLAGSRSPRRHLRCSEDRFLQRAVPAALAAARREVEALVRARDITQVIVFGGDLTELVTTLDPATVVLDVCDSRSLTLERALRDPAHPSTRLRRLADRLALHRLRATEGRFPARFHRVCAISGPDARHIEALSGPGGRVHIVPNGVGESFLAPLGPIGARRGVAFWGNLGFAPNVEALRFFVHDVYLPFLRDAGVQLCVVGADGPRWLTELSEREPGVVLTGFVDDLRSAVGDYPIMINPMRTGSGLKNKVLEAFGVGLAVVSTPLGVEALPAVRDGEHLLVAVDAAGFAGAVLGLLDDDHRLAVLRTQAHDLLHRQYRWDAVGRSWRAVLGRVGPVRPVARAAETT